MTKTLTKDEILNASNKLKREVVYVEELEGNVLVRELTAKERDDYEQSLMKVSGSGKSMQVRPDFTNAKAKMAVKCIIDDNGNRLFEDKDANAIGNLSARALNKVVDTIERLSGMTKQDIEELTKNSETAQSADSPSG